MKQRKKILHSIGVAAIVFMCGLGVLSGTTAQAKEGKTKNYKYTIEKKGKVVINEYIGKKKKVTIPKKIKGKQVYKIDFKAFSETDITSVTIPETVEVIEMAAFGDCKRLKKVTMKGTETVEAFAFENCPNLKKVVLSKDLRKIEDGVFRNCTNLTSVGNLTLDTVKTEAFDSCKKLTSKITLSDKCTYVGLAAFYGCENVELNIPDTVKEVDSYAFAFCQKLTKMIVPDGAEWEKIAKAYAGCKNIKEIDLQDKSGNVIEENGVLYNKDKSMVVYVLPTYKGSMDFLSKVKSLNDYALTGFGQEKVVLPSNIEKIGEGVLYGAAIKSVQWPGSVSVVPYNAFKYSDITELELPEGVKEIIDESIVFCKKLKKITLPKSFEEYYTNFEWNSIFRGLTALEKITVKKGNRVYYSKKGILFKKGSKYDTLVCYPAAKKGKTYKVPKKVLLDINCFDSLKYLRKVIIPKNSAIKSIWNYFVDCKNVTVTIPKTVKSATTSEHAGDFPLFFNCKNCKALVKKDAKVLKYFKEYEKYYPEMWAYEVVK